MDETAIQPGQRWDAAVQHALRKSAYMVVLLSRHSLARDSYVRKEIAFAGAVATWLPGHESFVVPARLEPIPDRTLSRLKHLRNLQYVDLFPSWEAGVAEIAAVVSRSRLPVRKRIPAWAMFAGAATGALPLCAIRLSLAGLPFWDPVLVTPEVDVVVMPLGLVTLSAVFAGYTMKQVRSTWEAFRNGFLMALLVAGGMLLLLTLA